jgi:hypothetical protein
VSSLWLLVSLSVQLRTHTQGCDLSQLYFTADHDGCRRLGAVPVVA